MDGDPFAPGSAQRDGPDSAEGIYGAFQEFERHGAANVAVFWGEGGAFCAGWDLKHAASLSDADALDPFDFPDTGEPPMAALGPSRSPWRIFGELWWRRMSAGRRLTK